MKRILKILLILILFIQTVYSQSSSDKNIESYYLYINPGDFAPAALGYRAFFSIDSSDENFSFETYYFRVNYTELTDYQSLYSLGERVAIDLDTINLIKPEEYFKGRSYCEIHKELSLMRPQNGKRMVIITDLSNTDRIKQEPDKKIYDMELLILEVSWLIMFGPTWGEEIY